MGTILGSHHTITIDKGNPPVYVAKLYVTKVYVLLALASYTTLLVTCSMWMSRTGVNTFSLVKNFMDSD